MILQIYSQMAESNYASGNLFKNSLITGGTTSLNRNPGKINDLRGFEFQGLTPA